VSWSRIRITFGLVVVSVLAMDALALNVAGGEVPFAHSMFDPELGRRGDG
jgi:hypothetical protein